MSNEQISKDMSLSQSVEPPRQAPPEERYPPLRRFDYDAMKKDKSHLRVLAIFHYILAVLIGMVGVLPGIYVALGVAMASGSMGPPPKGPPPELGFLFIFGGSLAILMLEALAVCVFIAGRSLTMQKRYIFCFVVAVLLCLTGNIPAMILAIFTIVVLARESVKELFTHGDLAFGPNPDED